jgi:hypothetical protein
MNNHINTLKKFSIHLKLADRVELVMAAHLIHGHVNRQTLMDLYGVNQVQAGSLIRDFIETHSVHIEWLPEHKHYIYSKTPKPVI